MSLRFIRFMCLPLACRWQQRKGQGVRGIHPEYPKQISVICHEDEDGSTDAEPPADLFLFWFVVQISEDGPYSCWTPDPHSCDPAGLGLHTGLLAAKLALNRLHQDLCAQGFTQVCYTT